MNQIRIVVVFGLLITASLMLIGCGEEDYMTSEKMKSLIENELSVGDSSEAIERFLDKHQITYTFNKYDSRYQCIIRDPSGKPEGYHSIVISIFVDEEKRFTKAEVRDSFTHI